MNHFKIELKWALIFSVMMLLWMVLERVVGLHDTHIDKHFIYTNFVAIPAVVVYVLALKDKRDHYFGGKMTYQQGLISGIIVSLMVMVLSPLTQIITSNVITPHFFSNVIRYTVEQGKMTQQEAEDYFNLKSYIVQGLMGAPVMGILTSAVVAFFVKKD